MKKDNQFVNTLEDNIRSWDVISILIKVIMLNPRSVIVHGVSFGYYVLMIFKVNHITRIRIFISAAIRQIRISPITFLTVRLPLPIYGFYPSYICASS